MGFFKKRVEKKEDIPKLPELPRLPELPEFPDIEENSGGRISQLPSFPNGSLGDKFSQNTIKEAITGKKEVEEVKADEFVEKYREGGKIQMMQKPLIREGGRRESYPLFEKTKTREAEPIFIRIDKFEEGSQTFEEVKKQILEIERMFEDIRKIKEKEEKELEFWEEEIKQIKEKIEKINNNIFSKME